VLVCKLSEFALVSQLHNLQLHNVQLCFRRSRTIQIAKRRAHGDCVDACVDDCVDACAVTVLMIVLMTVLTTVLMTC
jgi:hypothetical protein